jgi:hypothetical protein
VTTKSNCIDRLARAWSCAPRTFAVGCENQSMPCLLLIVFLLPQPEKSRIGIVGKKAGE